MSNPKTSAPVDPIKPSEPTAPGARAARTSASGKSSSSGKYDVAIMVVKSGGLPATSGQDGHDAGGTVSGPVIVGGSGTGGGGGPIHFPDDVVLASHSKQATVKAGGILQISLPISPDGKLLLGDANGADAIPVANVGTGHSHRIIIEVVRQKSR